MWRYVRVTYGMVGVIWGSGCASPGGKDTSLASQDACCFPLANHDNVLMTI